MKSHAVVVSMILLASVAGAQAPAPHASATPKPVHHTMRAAGASSAGMHMKIVSEDPETGAFTAIVTVPSGYRFKPASHPADQWVKIVKGSIAGGQGDTYDAKTIASDPHPLVAGDTLTLLAGKNYYGVARGPTQYIVCSSGRNATTYANAADDPARATRRASR